MALACANLRSTGGYLVYCDRQTDRQTYSWNSISPPYGARILNAQYTYID